ncbi:hypothetical protein U9M48_009573 [Paspalum notatum var. saurae]|uniref:Gnk2-homologous domain-containing protein n=1 Tax=Paspalum notatum var. saurae TaxID=547442 RepID=A0AAQ3SRG3_PASNO
MVSPKPFSLSSSLLILLSLLVVAAAGFQLEPAGTSRRFPPLLDCAPAPAPAQAAAFSKNSSAFRANVLSLLGALPSAAAAPRGSTAALSSRSGRDQAFARGLCLGRSPGDCHACLSAAAQDVASECGSASRRAGVWRVGCFLSYADTNASTAREDAFGGWFYDDSDDGAALESQCTANRTAAECDRCLDASAQVALRLKEENQLSKIHGDAVVFVRYGCYVRVPLFAPMPLWEQYVFGIFNLFVVVMVVLMEVGGVLYCIKIARWQERSCTLNREIDPTSVPSYEYTEPQRPSAGRNNWPVPNSEALNLAARPKLKHRCSISQCFFFGEQFADCETCDVHPPDVLVESQRVPHRRRRVDDVIVELPLLAEILMRCPQRAMLLNHPVESATTFSWSLWYALSHSDGPPPSLPFSKLLTVSTALVLAVTGGEHRY